MYENATAQIMEAMMLPEMKPVKDDATKLPTLNLYCRFSSEMKSRKIFGIFLYYPERLLTISSFD